MHKQIGLTLKGYDGGTHSSVIRQQKVKKENRRYQETIKA